MKLHPFQEKVKSDIYEKWASGFRRVLAVLPTGSGKTVLFSKIVAELNNKIKGIWVVAHRKELVGQISLSLALQNIRHNVIGPETLVSYCRKRHLEAYGVSFLSRDADISVVSVDTLRTRREHLQKKAREVGLWVIDEAHHVLRENKWGVVYGMMPKALGLGVTATPRRADGKGLGADSAGVFQVLVEGPRMRDLIRIGFLCDYRVACAPNIDVTGVPRSSQTGDFSSGKLILAVRRQRTKLFGDIVRNYCRLAPGKKAICFSTDVQTASDIAVKFREAGISAAVLTAKSTPHVRDLTLQKFRSGNLQIICNVGLFDEGFDVPGTEVVLDAAPTHSLAKFDQKFGRMMRVAPGKAYGLFLDFAGNVERHYPPDTEIDIQPARRWSLSGRSDKTEIEEMIPIRTCAKCEAPYARIYSACPYCGTIPAIPVRKTPEQVDGDLTLLDPKTLRRMRGDILVDPQTARIRLSLAGAPMAACLGVEKKIKERNLARMELRDAIELWGEHKKKSGMPVDEAYRRFFFLFGTDVISAQLCSSREAKELSKRILTSI